MLASRTRKLFCVRSIKWYFLMSCHQITHLSVYAGLFFNNHALDSLSSLRTSIFYKFHIFRFLALLFFNTVHCVSTNFFFWSFSDFSSSSSSSFFFRGLFNTSPLITPQIRGCLVYLGVSS